MSQGRTIQLVAAAVATLWISVPVLSVVHVLATEHNYCAEHGGLEEADHRSNSAHDMALDGSGDVSWIVAGTTRAGTDHEDCAIGEVFTQESLTSPRARGVGIVSPPAPQPWGGTMQCPSPSVEILHFAPKSSPPHLA